MASFPPPGTVTVCEINRELITADTLSDDRARDTYGKLLVNLLPEVDLQGVSWHQHKHIIAFISGSNQVIVRDYEDSEGKDPCILANEYQRDVKVLEWRPNGGRTLSVACNGGICIWAASYPGNAASVRSGAASFLGTLSRGSGIRPGNSISAWIGGHIIAEVVANWRLLLFC